MATGNRIAEKLPFECFLRRCFILLLLVVFSEAQANVLAQGQELTTGSQLISGSGIFTLGFYNPVNSNTSYIGISYNSNSQRPVWIANRNSPFPNNFGWFSLTIDSNGSLKIVSKGGGRDWYGYSFSLFEVDKPTNSSAILQDNGNFVLRELNPDGTVKQQLWQSFDHPTDTLLPEMKLGINHKTGSTWSLTSWRSDQSPQSGAFTLTMDPKNTNQLLILLRGVIFWTSGNWQRGRFEFLENLSDYNNEDINFNRVSNENETYFIYFIPKFDRSPSVVPNFNSYRFPYYESSGEILPQLNLVGDGSLEWDNQGTIFGCPLFENEFSADGCVWIKQHKIPECRNKPDVTQRYGYLEGNSSKFKESENLTMYECRNICISDCDCIACGSTDADGTGCEIWKAGAKFTSADEGAQWVWSVYNTDGFPYANGIGS